MNNFNRRNFLTAGLGLSAIAALSACTGTSAAPAPSGAPTPLPIKVEGTPSLIIEDPRLG